MHVEGKDIMLGDFNARHVRGESRTNSRGRALTNVINASRYQITAPDIKTYTLQGRMAHSTPDIFVANTTGIRLNVAGRDRWTGTSDHLPVWCTVPHMGEGEGGGIRRLSKMALHNEGRIKEVGKRYKKIAPEMRRKLQAATAVTAQKVYK